jgi:hypothetical protein
MAERKKIEVIWEDIIQSDASWREQEEGLDWSDSESGLVHQIGYLLDLDENHVVMVDSYFPSNETIGSVTRIPMVVVKELKYL